jgi:hypothetical protein
MLENNLKNNYAFLLPAFTFGLEDGMNPCNFASALIFVLFLARVGNTRKRIFWLGLLFVFCSMVINYGLTLGVLDRLITPQFFTTFAFVFYLLLAVVFIVLGGVNIFDRVRYEKYFNTQLFKCAVPVFLKDGQGAWAPKKSGFVGLVRAALFTVALGVLLPLLSTLYPQQEYIYIVRSYYMSGGKVGFAHASFIQYSIASVLPLLIAWVGVIFLEKARGRCGVVLYYKGISAALFLAVGIGLGYFLLR